MSKKKRNAPVVVTPKSFRLRKYLIGFALAIAIVLAGAWLYSRHQYRQELLVPDEVVQGKFDPRLTTIMRPWTELENKLVSYQADPAISRDVAAVYAELPRYKELVMRTFWQTSGLEIDYVSNFHPDDSTPGQIDPTITASQKKTAELLANLGQDSVGIEGAYCGHLTLPCFLKELLARTREVDPNISSESVEWVFRNDLVRDDSTLAYLARHPNSAMTGLEEWELHRLHFKTLVAANQRPWLYGPILRPLSEARSDIALARMIDFMRKNGKTRGVMVLGAGHAARIKEMMGQLGVFSRIYKTEPPSFNPGF